MNGFDITIVTPHIPTRGGKLLRAVGSVASQTVLPGAHVIVTDLQRQGSAVTRNRGLDAVSTPWVAFLDDDDEFMPNHLSTLILNAADSGADVLYTGCQPVGPDGYAIHRNEEWGRFGRPFDADLLRCEPYLPVTCLARTELAVKARFGPPEAFPGSDYDDWGFYLRMLDLGAQFLHVPKVTWVWHHHGRNTSGRSDRW